MRQANVTHRYQEGGGQKHARTATSATTLAAAMFEYCVLFVQDRARDTPDDAFCKIELAIDGTNQHLSRRMHFHSVGLQARLHEIIEGHQSPLLLHEFIVLGLQIALVPVAQHSARRKFSPSLQVVQEDASHCLFFKISRFFHESIKNCVKAPPELSKARQMSWRLIMLAR